MTWLAILLVLAQVFWQSKPPAEWNDIELARFLSDSPWAQMAAPADKSASVPPVQVYLATAEPVLKAVAERSRRAALRRPPNPNTEAPLREEFEAWFSDNRVGHIIVAARVGNTSTKNSSAFTSESEMRRMQQDCTLDLGHVKVKLKSYFPPTSSDPYLYLAFPRGPVSAADKSIAFDIYLPGVPGPFRTVHFTTKDMLLNGKLEM